MSKSTFDLLCSEVRKAIYDLDWDSFRKIQDESIEFICKTNDDLIISAPTASGKTEAAFLPAISTCIEDIKDSVQIIYVSPLKALINDQMNRVEQLCEHIDCKITKWHGDASISKKKKLIENPSGILLITPESLEALLIRKPTFAKEMFSKLSYFIIDEAHCFVGYPRGDQLNSLIHRYEKLINKNTRKILLSATLGSFENYKNWLNTDKCGFIEDKSNRGITGSIRIYNSLNEEYFLEGLANLCKSGKSLIFANSKGFLEESCSGVKDIAGDSDSIIEVHHGSLSKSQREYVESSLKEANNISVFCTNTLELGIDIGDIDEVGLISPPFSCSSFIQRIGRSGREKGKPINFSFHLNQFRTNDKSHICDKIHDYLIQAISLLELSIYEKWCEPGEFSTNSYSTFVHQLMSHIAQKRYAKPSDIKRNIISPFFNKYISDNECDQIIKNLIENDLLTKDSQNGIELGIEGDYLTENFEFYSVFFTPEEWSLINNGKSIGSIPLKNLFNSGDSLLFAGKRWIVNEVDFQSKSILISPGKGGIPPKFSGSGGSVHKRVHEKILEVYSSNKSPRYLNESGEALLYEARSNFKLLTEDESFLPVFSGSGVAQIVSLILNSKDITHDNIDIGIYSEGSKKKDLVKILKSFNTTSKITSLLTGINVEDLYFEKYDYLLPKEILVKSFMSTKIDVKGYIDFLKNI